jgi:hypothetical protein
MSMDNLAPVRVALLAGAFHLRYWLQSVAS